MAKVVIIGGGETAELAYEYFTHDSPHEVVAFSVARAFVKSPRLFDLPVVPFEEIERHYDPQEHKTFVAISHTQLNRVRARLYHETKRTGYACVSYVSSLAFVWRTVELGENCFIMEQNVLQHAVRVGNNVVLWSGNHVGHRSVIKDHCFISSHVVIAGYCEIGESCFFGVNSCLANYLRVARDCFIDMGAIVNQDTKERGVYRGNPATRSNVDSLRAFRVKE